MEGGGIHFKRNAIADHGSETGVFGQSLGLVTVTRSMISRPLSSRMQQRDTYDDMSSFSKLTLSWPTKRLEKQETELYMACKSYMLLCET